MRVTATTLSLALLMSLGQSGHDLRQEARDKCIESLSGFPNADTPPAKPPYPVDLAGVTLTYFASGCYGNCPAFTLAVSKNTASFDGHAYVRAKGKHTAKVTRQEFETFLHAWYDGNFHAMRDDYCDIRCPDGTQIIITDIPESSITLTTPTFTKRVYECFTTVDHRPETPKPPDQYFELSRQLLAFAKAKHWL